jgi:GT2 family glycosyltransferase/glycosyltransferase involved in cell wall biosynthesis
VTSVSVVIPNYRRPALLRRCLESVMAARAASSHAVEIVVVDDGSADESCSVVSSEFAEAKLIALERNRGYAGAVNAGVSAASGDWVLTLNNDTIAEPDLFDQLLAVAESAPDVGIVAAQQRFASDRARLYSAGMRLDARGHASDRMMGMPVDRGEREPTEVFGACGAAALYRRAVLLELGGFDERFIFGLEDADVAWRARMRGWRCMYAPGAVVYHELGATLAHGTERRLFLAGRNRWLLIAKNLDRRQLVRHLPSIVAFDVGYVAFACVALRSLAPLRGRVAALRGWRAARAAGAAGRIPVALAPPAPLREALARRRAWRHAGGPERPPHVLVLNQYAPPDPASTGAFAHEVAVALAAEGSRVTFLAGQPSYVASQPCASRHEERDGVRIVRLRILRRGGRARRGWRFAGYLSYLARAAVAGGRLILTDRVDTILAFHNPPLLKLLAAGLAGRRRNLVCVLLDLHPDVLLATRWMRLPRFVVAMWEGANSWALGRATRVVVLSPGMREVLVEKGVDPAKVEVVPLWARPELTPMGRPRSGRELKLVFAGNLGITQQLAPVRDAAAALIDEPVHFWFVGNDAPRAQLNGLPNVSFMPFQSEADYRALVSASDAGIVTLALGLERLVVPSRALPFLSAGVPLLAVMNPDSELGQLISDYSCGVCVTSADELVRAVKRWVREPDGLRMAGARAREAYEATRDRRQLIHRYVELCR